MRRAYFDSSAIVKLVCEEPESLALVDFLGEPMEAITSAIAEVEVPRALRRLGFTAEEADAALGGFFIVSVDAAILARAAHLQPPVVRSLDAIHLATALEVNAAELQVVTYDERLADAARGQGLSVVQPQGTLGARL